MQWLILAFAIIANAAANISIKAGMLRFAAMDAETSIIKKVIMQPYLWLGASCFGLALLAYSYTLSKMDLSVAYPIMTSVGLLVVALASFLMFQESFTALKILGTVLIIAGVILVSL